MSHTVVGLFNNRNAAQIAVQKLAQKGFTAGNIDLSHKAAARGGADDAATRQTETTQIEVTDSVGDFFGFLFGDDQTAARNYAEVAGDADAILTVHADSYEKARQAAEILDRSGAIDIDAASSEQGQGNLNETAETGAPNTTQTAETLPPQTAADVQSATTIPVIEEQLQVGKRVVESGGARVHSRIVEKPVEASVRLREEHVVVNRRPVNRAFTDADLAGVKEGDIELTERAEVPVVAKQSRVVEEVVVGKNVTEHDETIRDTVRRTEVDVEEVNKTTAARNADNKSRNEF